jgi:PEP-CTERM motif
MRLRVLLIGALSSAFATASFASMITNGTFSIAGTIFVTGAGGVTTPAGVCPSGVSCIFFQDTGAPAQNGKIDISPLSLPSGDIPLAIAGNDAGNIQSLINPPDTPPSFPAVNFISFTNAGITTVLRVNSFPLGINSPAGCAATPPAAGQTCSIPGSPFNLQNLTATASTATFTMGGITNDSSSTWTGIFASQFNTIPYQTLLSQLSTNGFVSNTFSGQITLVAPTTTPEPGTMPFLLLGAGMIAGATFLRRLRA